MQAQGWAGRGQVGRWDFTLALKMLERRWAAYSRRGRRGGCPEDVEEEFGMLMATLRVASSRRCPWRVKAAQQQHRYVSTPSLKVLLIFYTCNFLFLVKVPVWPRGFPRPPWLKKKHKTSYLSTTRLNKRPFFCEVLHGVTCTCSGT